MGRGEVMAATLRTYLELVRFSHTIFALPFAFMGAVVAARGVPPVKVSLLIVLAINLATGWFF